MQKFFTFIRSLFWGNWVLKLIQFLLVADFLIFGLIFIVSAYVYISEGGQEMAILALAPAIIAFFITLGAVVSAIQIRDLRNRSQRNGLKIAAAIFAGIVGLSPFILLCSWIVTLFTRSGR